MIIQISTGNLGAYKTCACACVCTCEGAGSRETHWTNSAVIIGSIQIVSFRSQQQMKALQNHLPPPLLQSGKSVARKVCWLQMWAMVIMKKENLELIIQYKYLLEGNVEE